MAARSYFFGYAVVVRQPLFDNVLVGQALREANSQSDVMAGFGLPPDMYLQSCYSV
jgi:hypothetical protein